MTKRRDVIKTIAAEAKRQSVVFGVEREGANHTVFNLDGLMIPSADTTTSTTRWRRSSTKRPPRN